MDDVFDRLGIPGDTLRLEICTESDKMTKAEAEEARKLGNDAMKSGKHFEAMIHYTHAIKNDPRNHEYYSNRSLALLKVDQYYHARLDAIKAIELKPDWPKAYYRKGEVEFKAQHYKDALNSYKVGLSISPEDTGLQQAVQKAGAALKLQRQKEARVPLYGTSIGFVVGLIIVIADETVAPRPVLDYSVLKLILIASLVGVGYVGSLVYNWFQKNQRDVLMEEPIDLFGDGKDDDLMYPKGETNESSSTNNKKSEKHRKGGVSGGRQRFKKGKS